MSREAGCQVYFLVTKYNTVHYFALYLPYSTDLVSLAMIWVTERDNILSHSILTTSKTGIGGWLHLLLTLLTMTAERTYIGIQVKVTDKPSGAGYKHCVG